MFYTDDIVFVHISLTGGSSVSKAFGQQNGHKVFNEQRLAAHATAHEIRAIMGEDEWAKRWSFAIVRNPWDKLVSIYHSWRRDFKLQKEFGERWMEVFENTKDFKSFLYNYPNDPMADQSGTIRTPQKYWANGVDQVFKYEDFDALSVKMREIGYDGIIPTVQRFDAIRNNVYHRPDVPYQEYYNDELINLVAEWFDEDIKEYGYTF